MESFPDMIRMTTKRETGDVNRARSGLVGFCARLSGVLLFPAPLFRCLESNLISLAKLAYHSEDVKAFLWLLDRFHE